MIYTEESMMRLTHDLKEAARVWAEAKIDELFGQGGMVATYAKRGLRNYMASKDETITKGVSAVSMFVRDEHGRIDTDALMDDMLEAFKQMKRQETYVAGMKIEYGQGEVLVPVPHGLLYDMVFGRFGTIRITADDIAELKGLISS
jgi:hypothetical protein